MGFNFDPTAFMESRANIALIKELVGNTADSETEARRDKRAARKLKQQQADRQDRLDALESGIIGGSWTDSQRARYHMYGEIPSDEAGLPEIKGFTD